MQTIMKPISGGSFRDGNPYTGDPGTIVTAEWLNSVQSAVIANQEELLSILNDSGQAIDAKRKDQLLQAIKQIAWGDTVRPTTLAAYGVTDGATKTEVKAAAPAGEVAHFAMEAAPAGWLKANGATVSRSQYADLYKALGDRFTPKQANVQAMLRLDAADGLSDRVGGGAVSLLGGANLSNGQAKFGSLSLKTATNGGYASFVLAEAFNPNAFTIEGWHYPTFEGSGSSYGYSCSWITSVGNGAITSAGISLAIDKATKAPLIWVSNSYTDIFIHTAFGEAGVFASSRWYHIAFGYDGTTYRLWVDGKVVWSQAQSRKISSASTLFFGVEASLANPSGSAVGYYQDWKVSKENRYSANFTPPTTPTTYQLDMSARNEFYLPDLRGEFVRGWDDRRGVDGGRLLAAAQPASEIAANILTNGSNAYPQFRFIEPAAQNWNLGEVAVPADGYPQSSGQIKRDLSSTTYQLTGGAGAVSFRPRNIALLACIKY
ncbi:tail fiber protein [Neisseriaceae bacterium TC5R-5]|nr:tail fiber protein [Neisseriaceae bacterium TC5R-5]